MAKKAKKKDIEYDDPDLHDSEIDDDSLGDGFTGDETPPEEDDTAYTMGDIVVDDGSADEGEDEDKQILKQKSSLTPAEGEEDDVWVDEIDVFDDSDPYLEGADYDPENAGDYYD